MLREVSMKMSLVREALDIIAFVCSLLTLYGLQRS